MKAKLLKKLRKRFYWYRQGTDSFWHFYDRKTNKTEYAFIVGVRYSNDALILSLLSRLGLQDLYIPRDKKLKEKREKKLLDNRKKYFSQFFK